MSLPTEISRSIDRAIDHLRRERANGKPIADAETGDGLMFLGQWHDAYPTVLVRDPFLTDSAKIQWLYLAQEARKQPQGAIGMPSIQESAQALHQARGTVIRDRLLLRVCRWISAVRSVRDPDTGRFLGHIYAMHGEPIQWHAAIAYDAHYVELIERSESHQDRRVQRAARANLKGIRGSIIAGEDPLVPIDPVAMRITTAQAIESGWGTAWGVPLEEASPGTKFGPGDEPGPDLEPGESPGPDFGPGYLPGPNFGLGDQVIDFANSPNLGPGAVRSSSNKYKKTTTTTTVAARARKDADQERTALNWPTAFDDNLRRLIHQTLSVSVAATHHQDVVDALAHKVLDRTNPLRNPVAYAITLCSRIKAGTFQPVGPPLEATAAVQKPAAPSQPNRSVLRSQLTNELSGLKRLRSAGHRPARAGKRSRDDRPLGAGARRHRPAQGRPRGFPDPTGRMGAPTGSQRLSGSTGRTSNGGDHTATSLPGLRQTPAAAQRPQRLLLGLQCLPGLHDHPCRPARQACCRCTTTTAGTMRLRRPDHGNAESLVVSSMSDDGLEENRW